MHVSNHRNWICVFILDIQTGATCQLLISWSNPVATDLPLASCQHPQDWYHYMQCTNNQALSGKQQRTGKVSTLKQSSHIFNTLQPTPTRLNLHCRHGAAPQAWQNTSSFT